MFRCATWQQGYYPDPLEKHIRNLSSYDLSLVEKQALCRGLNFSVPHRVPQILIDAQFVRFFQQLPSENTEPTDAVTKLKADLVSCAKSFSTTPLQRSLLSREHLTALKALQQNQDVVILRPDKGDGVVVLNRSDYVAKMELILSDSSKFSPLESDNTDVIEKKVNESINLLTRSGAISEKKSACLRSRGTHVPRLYGLPQLHKEGIPLRPILSMCDAPTYKLAKWLSTVLLPIRNAVCQHSVKDSFTFVDKIKSMKLNDSCNGLFRCHVTFYQCSFT